MPTIENVGEEERDEDFVTDDEDDVPGDVIARINNGEHDDEDEDDSDDDDDFKNETLLERLSALVDVIPYSQRRSVYLSAAGLLSTGFAGLRVAGKGLWVVATGALLLALPVALEVEREHFTLSQENSARLQQAQAAAVQNVQV
ncbi:hypothetical protein HK101_006670 [Irineochytrium annulatum]|nr:hypothetical protein HK101_006670 [Irineochytrium annulatum]